ncbi:hypothetical protein SCOCK_380041 [Actinacidiphila cocklensis]|uniref:Uncharacterized protein n=1 Tax=Actinacidiphila cocklensis TaxID=887465 RepID=A0A9W4GSK0_9ACTN|nr:hypothetical protein SCOCK_380041 [Actinacidiphila cocklensis]
MCIGSEFTYPPLKPAASDLFPAELPCSRLRRATRGVSE